MKLRFTSLSARQYKSLEEDPSKKALLKAVRKALGFMEVDLRHSSLKTHVYRGFSGESGEKVFGAYAQNNTPGAYRILWHYGPGNDIVTIIAIVPHL